MGPVAPVNTPWAVRKPRTRGAPLLQHFKSEAAARELAAAERWRWSRQTRQSGGIDFTPTRLINNGPQGQATLVADHKASYM